MTNFNKTLLAVGISLALGFSAGAWADATNTDNDDSLAVAVDASDDADIENGSDGAIAQGGGAATHDQSEAEIDDYSNGAAANNGGVATLDQSEADADDDSAAANNGGVATLDQSENTSATAGGDAFAAQNGGEIDYNAAAATGGDALSAQNGGEIEHTEAVGGRDALAAQNGGEIDQEVENEYSDGSVAVREGDVNFSSFESDQENLLTHNVLTITSAQPLTQSNDITDSVNGSAGVIQLSQNTGGIASVNQNVNVLGTVTVANVGIAP